MLAILATTFPFFALVLCGYIAVRRQMLPQLAIPGMNGFVLYFALPCLLYRFGSTTPIAQLLDPGVFGVYLAAAVLVVALTVYGTLRRAGWNDAAFGALVAAFPNTGFMGVPLLVALLGPRASGPVIVTMVIDLIITTSLCIALSRLGQGGRAGQVGQDDEASQGGRADEATSCTSGAHSVQVSDRKPSISSRLQGSRAALRNALAGMLRNPMPWAIALGALASATGFVLPGPAARTVGLLADAASPVALFTIGAVLARSQMNASARTPLAGFVPVSLVKLLLHPLLILGLGHAAIAAGVALDPFSLTVLVLVGCLPSASNVALLAERFGADTGRVARIILVSTALSFLTFSGAVALLT
jgi:malonate transporter and related proteins